ncbi:MAG: hypothetical protein V4510_04085 [bacterium]
MPLPCPFCGTVVEPGRDATGRLLCPACRNTGRMAPPQFSSPEEAYAAGYYAAAAARDDAQRDKRVRHAKQEGVCAVVFAGVGLLLAFFAVAALACGVAAILHGRRLERGGQDGTVLPADATTGRNAFIMGVIGVCVAPVTLTLNILLILRN